ncbi:MAG TPA: hypothetical protein VFS55_16060 [Dokdonella sp.]|nr:hypothetical protein [Dokdonella sp.]
MRAQASTRMMHAFPHPRRLQRAGAPGGRDRIDLAAAHREAARGGLRFRGLAGATWRPVRNARDTSDRQRHGVIDMSRTATVA